MAEVLCAGMVGLKRLGAGGGAAKAPCWRRLGRGASCGGGGTREIQAYGGCICGKVRADAARWWRFWQWGLRIRQGDRGFSEVSSTSLQVRTLLSPPLMSSIFVDLLNHMARVDGGGLRSGMLCGVELDSVGSYA